MQSCLGGKYVRAGWCLGSSSAEGMMGGEEVRGRAVTGSLEAANESRPSYMHCGVGADVGLAAGGRQASVAERSDG